MSAQEITLIIGAFFAGLTGFAVATLPLIIQLRNNTKTTKVNAAVTAANTVAITNGSGAETPETALMAALRSVMAAPPVTPPVASPVTPEELRDVLSPTGGGGG